MFETLCSAPWSKPPSRIPTQGTQAYSANVAVRPAGAGPRGGSDGLSPASTGCGAGEQVVFLADGATWIWGHIEWITQAVGIDKHSVTEVLDFYHAAPTDNSVPN
ncbi:MAG: hypothetical protein O3A00_26460 [Planctomycetota bacterium]|nr:hypothetical protein [Planctomycetota bacterium]